ncbi:hypothetical protein [Rhizobium herbae]
MTLEEETLCDDFSLTIERMKETLERLRSARCSGTAVAAAEMDLDDAMKAYDEVAERIKPAT